MLNSIKQAQTVLHDELEVRAQALHAHSDSSTFNQEITAIWEVRHLLELVRPCLRLPTHVMNPVAR